MGSKNMEGVDILGEGGIKTVMVGETSRKVSRLPKLGRMAITILHKANQVGLLDLITGNLFLFIQVLGTILFELYFKMSSVKNYSSVHIKN